VDRHALSVRSDNVAIGADILNNSLTKFACCVEEDEMERQDACVKMGFQDAIELLPGLLCKIVPPTRTFLLRLTSKTMRTAVENAKLDVVVKPKWCIKFHNGAGLQDKLNNLNAWCRVIVLRLVDCELGAAGAREIAAVLRVNSTLHTLNLENNEVGADGAREIAAALRVNSTLHTLDLENNEVGADGAREIAAVLRVNSTLQTLNLWSNQVGADGAREIAAVLRVNSTLHTLNLENNEVGADGAREIGGGAEYQVQEAMNHAVTNWRKTILRDTNAGLHSISQAASKGAQGDLMSNERWGRECMLQLQEDENWNKPTTTTWAAEFLLREGESRELLGSWIRSGAVPEAKKRRAKQVITCSFPCGQWLYKIGARANPRCELCRRERETRGASIDSLPPETVAHIQSAGCNLQKKSVIGAHNRCWKYLIGAISTHGEAKRSLEVLGGDKDRQLHILWKETKIGEILPWEDIEEEAEELIARSRVERRASASNQANQQREDESGGDEKDPSEEVIFGQRRPDSLAIDWTNKMVYVLEFKRTSDQRRDYREKAESRARVQHDVLIRSLEKVAGETESEGERWKVKLIVFVGGTCGSVHVQTFNCNLKELGVLESKRGAIRKGLVQELLYAQDTVLCSYFAQREGATHGDKGRRSTAAEVFQGLDRFG
jgi:uncharacterized protein YacL (UPF0231 family)